MEVVYHSKSRKSNSKPTVSLILLDWSCRESFHSLDYLNKQTVPRQTYEILWIEYYTRKPSEIEDNLKKSGESAIIDHWIVLGMPADVYYHKHLMYNIGIVKSRGDIVVICDSDAIYGPSFVETIIKSFQDDPDIVLHLDQVRNINKKFYPFSYPSIKKILGKGCINFKDGKTTGLWDQSDTLHSRNYGACMTAKRVDMIEIGGADEHLDYVGHVCGPYEMTFRLKNLGRKEIWHDKEFLYHAWHPGQSGDGNYVGPHDGRLISTTALGVLDSGRIQPLVENKAIEMLRTGGVFTEEELEEKLVDASYIRLFAYDETSKKGKMQLWYNHELIRFHRDYNIIRYKGELYGIPAFLRLEGLDKEKEEKFHPTIVTAKTVRGVVKKINKFDPLSLRPRILCRHNGYNIVQYGRRVYGVPQGMPDTDFHDPQQRLEFKALSADTVEAAKELVDKTDRSLHFPVMLETYQEYSIVKCRGKIYGVPQSLGKVDFYDPQQRCEIEDLSADTVEAVKELIDKTDRSLYWPTMLEVYQEYNIVKYRGKIYGVPHSLGKVDFTQKSQRSLPGILSADTQQELISLIEQKESTEDKQSVQVDNICVLEKYEYYNIVSSRSGVYGVPESFGSVDSICEFWLYLPGVISANSCDEVRKLIRSANPLFAMPLLLDEYKNHNMIRYDGCYYAAPHSIGGVDFCNDKERSHPEIISASSRSELKVEIDKLEKAVPVEYTGWLPQFREFGNCGSHPQFRHIKRPPEGYRFTYSEPAGNGQLAKKTLRQRISLLVSYNPLSTMPLLLVQLFFAAFKLALSAWSKGANWHYIFHFFKTRGIKLQLLIPRKRNLLFLPSVPYTLGQHPWVIEIEDSTSLLFPFIHNGSTDSECFQRSPYFPILKALFESRSCRAIVTHIKSTAESLPKLFQSDKLTSKIEYVPLGVNTPVTYHKIEEEDDNIRILFNNSWHQDPRSFFIRGGLDVLRAFDRLHKRYSNVSLTLRTSLPNMHPRYADIIERNNIRVINNFMPDKEWEELMISSNIYLLPSDRVHVVSMLEAMSYGLAVVVSDGWGVGDYVQHGHNGMVVKGRYGKITWMDHKTGMLCERYELMQKEDPVVIGDITETLSSLIEDKQLRHRISQQARKDVKDKYNLENWNKGLKRAFDRALGVNAKV